MEAGIDVDWLLYSNFNVNQLNISTNSKIPPFYVNMLHVWSELNQTSHISKELFLWYNSDIPVQVSTEQ